MKLKRETKEVLVTVALAIVPVSLFLLVFARPEWAVGIVDGIAEGVKWLLRLYLRFFLKIREATLKVFLGGD